MTHIDLAKMPPVSHAHLAQAFALMHWTGWTLEAALQDDLRRRVIVARAHQIRTDEYLATLTDEAKKTVRRCRVDAQGNEHWVTQTVHFHCPPAGGDLFKPGAPE